MANVIRNSNTKSVTRYMELLYMASSVVRAKDIAVLLQDNARLKIELWDEMNVLELELSNQNTVDFDPLNTQFQDPFDASFIKSHNINTIFAVNLNENDFEMIKSLFEKIIEQFSGFLCADTVDFNPIYVGTSVK